MIKIQLTKKIILLFIISLRLNYFHLNNRIEINKSYKNKIINFLTHYMK